MAEAVQKKLRSRRRQILELSLRARQAFAEALLDPEPINDRLRETVRLYRQAAGV